MVPTPTPYAYAIATPAININASDYGLWQYSGDVINVWNYEPNLGLMIQWSIIVVLVVSFVVLLYRLIQGTIESDE